MPQQKRLRVFAGPNGSGKTTIVKDLEAKIPFGIYVNADDIEKNLKENEYLLLSDYNLNSNTENIQTFFKESTFSPKKLNNENLWQHFYVTEGKLFIDDTLKINSYIAADIAEFIRQNLLASGKSFAYETVMSYDGKLDFFKMAKDAGYKVYLYYIATEDPDININRVNVRVAQHGHAVDPEIIKSRYFRSLENLRQAVLLSNRAYIFDNSGAINLLIAEITEGKDVEIVDPDTVPNWFMKYLVDKE